ncbi:MAG TPA: hypothetical protein VF120_13740 [Ktedonobacterales bacterium]
MARRRKQPKPAPQARQKKPHAPSVPSRARDTAEAAFGHGASGLPSRGPHGDAGASHAIELTAPPSAGLSDVLLELAGAEHGGLSRTFAAWQREQDRILNRAWRRPGGLARPGGL